MLKKLLLVLALLTTSLFSFQLDMWQEKNKAVLNFNIYYDNVGGDEGTNWVAIYKAGASNDWDNVLTWAWAKDLAHSENNYDERLFPLVTDAGSYEVRFFLNNSYDVFSTYTYTVGGNDNKPYIGVADVNNNAIIFNSLPADQAWIGIYKRGASNDWNNVQAWSWATDDSTTIDIANLNGDTYEARLFYNNSYDVEATVTFTKEGGNDKGHLSIETQTSSKITLNSTGDDKAWIGIYNKDASNDWNNVQAWSWVDSPTTIDISNLAGGDYEARLFYNNSYDLETTLEFSKDANANIKKVLVQKSIDENNDGVYEYIHHNSYDDRGNLIQKIVEDDSEDASYTSTFTYDENNHLLISDINDNYENQHRVFTYDEQGRKETMTHNSADGSYKTYFTYDDRGNLIKEDETGNYDGEDQHRVRTYVYNANNQLLEKRFKIGIGYTTIDVYEYDGDNLIKETHSYNGEAQNPQEYIYNENNQLIKKVKKTLHGQSVYEYTYNENGKITEEKYTTSANQVYITKYSYDDDSNLIKEEKNNKITTYVWKKL